VNVDALTPPSCVCLLFSQKRYSIIDKSVLASDVTELAAQIEKELLAGSPRPAARAA